MNQTDLGSELSEYPTPGPSVKLGMGHFHRSTPDARNPDAQGPEGRDRDDKPVVARERKI